MKTQIRSLVSALGLAPALLMVACGGGSDGPKPAPGALQVLLRDGDEMPGGFVIGTIEEARMAGDRSTSMIVSEPLPGTARAVFRRSAGGDVNPVLTPTSAATGIDLASLRGLTMTQAGDLDFKSGQGLDTDVLFLFANGGLSIAAQAGNTPPGFRLLGEDEIASGGEIAFTAGKSPCTVDTTTGEERVRCDLEVYRGSAASLTKVPVSNDLSDQQATSISLVLGVSGTLIMGLPARGNDPVLAASTSSGVTPLIRRGQSFEGIGVLSSVRPRAVAANDDVVLDARVDEDGDGRVDGSRVFLRRASSGELVTAGQTGEPAGDTTVTTVRGIGIDGDGRAYYSAGFADPGQESRTSLRFWEGGQKGEIAYEGQDLGEEDEQGNGLQILQIDQGRVLTNGEFLFRATAGFFEEDTRRITDTRIIRYATNGNRRLETLVKTGTLVPGGSRIVSLSIADVNEAGDLLLIGSLDRAAVRSLLFLPRS